MPPRSLKRPQGRGLAAVLALVPFASIGLARFAYGLILPTMSDDLGWSYLDAGIITTGNAAGYLVGAAMGASLGRRFGQWNMIIVGVVLMAFSLAATGAVSSLGLILVFRFLAGLFGGWCFISAGVRATQLSRTAVPEALIWFTAGGGLAIVISAGGQSLLDATVGGWRASWFALGLLSCLAAVVLGLVVAREDEDNGATSAGVNARSAGLEISYGLFGLGYISYVTFIGAYVKAGTSGLSPTQFWAVLGAMGLVAAFVWPRLFGRYGAGAMYPVTLALCSLGVVIILIDRSAIGSLVSATLFGGSFLAVVSGVTAAARDRIDPAGWASAIGWLTVTFGAGQVLGPLLGGALGDTTAGLRLGLGASAIILLVGSGVALVDYQRQP